MKTPGNENLSYTRNIEWKRRSHKTALYGLVYLYISMYVRMYVCGYVHIPGDPCRTQEFLSEWDENKGGINPKQGMYMCFVILWPGPKTLPPLKHDVDATVQGTPHGSWKQRTTGRGEAALLSRKL